MWQQLLTSNARAQALDAVAGIADELADNTAGVDDPWSAAQRALVLWECSRATDDRARQAQAESLADLAVELSATTTMHSRFMKGFVGVAWLFEIMQDPEPEEDDDDAEVDDAVRALIDRDPRPSAGYLDLISGLVGAGVYLLARPPSTRIEDDLAELVYRLEESAEYLDDGIAWWGYTVLGPDRGADCYNLGLAHGVPGVVAFLARALQRGIAPKRTRMLLDGAVRWLLGQRLSSGPSCYPTICTQAGPDGPARAAWCYGDPGVALALLAASSATGRRDWEAEAVDVALTAARRPFASCQAHDASVCHGTAGLVHVFNRLFQATGHTELGRAARRWVDPTLRLLAAGRWDGVPQSDEPEHAKVSNVLEGKAGIALALLSAATATPPAWDGMLLADVGPSPSACARVVA